MQTVITMLVVERWYEWLGIYTYSSGNQYEVNGLGINVVEEVSIHLLMVIDMMVPGLMIRR